MHTRSDSCRTLRGPAKRVVPEMTATAGDVHDAPAFAHTLTISHGAAVSAVLAAAFNIFPKKHDGLLIKESAGYKIHYTSFAVSIPVFFAGKG